MADKPASTDDVLLEKFKQLSEGFDHMDVITALSSLLSQAIADAAPDVPHARLMADRVNKAIKADIASNWHLVLARRVKGRSHV
jgi:hypothetical protein